VRREEDGRPAVRELSDEFLEEGAARDGVEAEGRVVEEEELGRRGEGEREGDERRRAVISGGASGSSGTTPMRAMRGARCFQTSSPKRRQSPAVGFCCPRRQRTREDLPAPLRPSRP